jgi:hypothetical protein
MRPDRAGADLRVCLESFASCSGSCEPAEHEADHRKIDEGRGNAYQALEVLGEASAAAEPCEGAFDDPALGQDLERRVVGAANDLEAPRPVGYDGLFGVFAAIGGIGDDADQTRAFPGHRLEQVRRAVAVLDTSAVDRAVDDQALRVDEDVALLAPDPLRRVIARRIDARPPFSAPLTLCESMMPRLGLESRPARVRISARSTS